MQRPTTALLALALAATAPALPGDTGSVVFFHPDGFALAHWTATRIYWHGPDGALEWDRLPHVAVYRGHLAERVAGTSNGGATAHAFGYKVEGRGSFGRDGDGSREPPSDRAILALSGYPGSILREAANAGHPVGVVNDGNLGEPGTGAFLAEVGNRDDWDEIARQMVQGRPGAGDTAPWVLLGGGERNFLPAGADGVHGPGARRDGADLLADARTRGYRVVRTRAEFEALRDAVFAATDPDSPDHAPRVLGVFAHHHTFNDAPEEQLVERGFATGPVPHAYTREGPLTLWGTPAGGNAAGFAPPTTAEMTDLALVILGRRAVLAGLPFALVVEPESCDNFSNVNNGIGALHAGRRADDALGVIRRYIAGNPRTLVVTAADSDASGLQVIALGTVPDPFAGGPVPEAAPAFRVAGVDVPSDGLWGAGSPAFTAGPARVQEPLRPAPGADAPKLQGRQTFALAWIGGADTAGGILSRAEGLHAGLVSTEFGGTLDNTDVYRLLYRVVFGRLLPPSTTRAPDRPAAR